MRSDESCQCYCYSAMCAARSGTSPGSVPWVVSRRTKSAVMSVAQGATSPETVLRESLTPLATGKDDWPSLFYTTCLV